jgi:Fic family protein
LVEEFINIQKEAFREQKAIYDAIQAAKKLDISDGDIRNYLNKELV